VLNASNESELADVEARGGVPLGEVEGGAT
jgi:hypothetical protein